MKKTLLTLSSLTLLAGCSLLTPKQFDATEYNYTVQTTVAATRAVHLCGNKPYEQKFNGFVNDLNANSMALMEYASHRPVSEGTYQGIAQIRALTTEFVTRDKPSDMYCRHKLSSIQGASRTLSRALGEKGEYDICASNVEERFKLYVVSKNSGKISEDEFKELTNDLLELAAADKASCSIENKKQLDNAIELIRAGVGVVSGLL